MKSSPLLLKYLEQFKNHPDSMVFAPLAESYRKMGLLDEALKVLKVGMRKHPNYLLGKLILANCYFDQDKIEEAYHLLAPLSEQHRDNLLLQKLLAQCCKALGQREQALMAYKSLLLMHPRSKEFQVEVALLEEDLQQVVIEEGEGRTNSVVHSEGPGQEQELWQELVPDEKKPTAPMATQTLVDLYIAQKLYSRALEVCQKLYQLTPYDSSLLEKISSIKKLMQAQMESCQQETLRAQLHHVQQKLENFLLLIQQHKTRRQPLHLAG